jgi:hypothetical protein
MFLEDLEQGRIQWRMVAVDARSRRQLFCIGLFGIRWLADKKNKPCLRVQLEPAKRWRGAEVDVSRMSILGLQAALEQSKRENWCTNRNCTTCGCPQMRNILLGRALSVSGPRIRLDDLSSQRAAQIIQELKHVAPPTNDEAIMWLLHAIWLRFGDDAHRNLFSDLDDSYANSILNRMKEHYSRLRGP